MNGLQSSVLILLYKRYAGKRFFQDNDIPADQQVFHFHGCVHCRCLFFLCPGLISGFLARYHDAASAVHSLVILGTHRLFCNCHCYASDIHIPTACFCHKETFCPGFLYIDGFYFPLCLYVHHCLCLIIAFEHNARTR